MPSKITPFALIGYCLRRVRYSWWGILVRLAGPLCFREIGPGVKFNGWVRIEKPGSDIKVGTGSMIGVGCYFLATSNGNITIGDRVIINDFCYLTSDHSIKIGNNVQIAEFVSVRDYDHEFARTDIPISQQGLRGAPISIGEGTWIGRGVMITSGVTIGAHCVVGANAVVTRDLPDWSVAAGIPARILRSRKP